MFARKQEVVFRQCMFAEGRRLYSDKVCLLKAGGCIKTKYVCCRQEVVLRQSMFAEGRRLY